MKVLIQNGYGSVEALQYMDMAEPVPRDNEVLVKVCTTAMDDWELGILHLPKILRSILGRRGLR